MAGLGSMENEGVSETVHTPLDPKRLAVASPVGRKGGLVVRGATLFVGSVFRMGAPVSKVYVLAPEEVRVMVFGEPLKAWAQRLGLLRETCMFGGGTTRA